MNIYFFKSIFSNFNNVNDFEWIEFLLVHKDSYVYRINGIKLQGIIEDYILIPNKIS